jgi:hypothetical protein
MAHGSRYPKATKCLDCGSPNLATCMDRGRVRTLPRCAEHHKEYQHKQYELRKAKLGNKQGARRNSGYTPRGRTVDVPPGMVRAVIRSNFGKVIIYDGGERKEVMYRTLKRLNTPKKLIEAFVGMGYHITKKTHVETVLEKRVA